MFVFGSLKSVVKPRPGYRRLIVLLGVFNFMCYIFTYNGTEGSHRYYYAQAGISIISNHSISIFSMWFKTDQIGI